MHIRGTGYLYRPKWTDKEGKRVESGVWWWKVNGRAMSTGCREETDAKRWVKDRLTRMSRGHLVGRRSRALRWRDVTKMLLERWTVDRRAGMLAVAPRVFRPLAKVFGDLRLDEITTALVTSYSAERLEAGASVSTINLELSFLRRGFSIANEAEPIAIPAIHHLPGAKRRTGTLEPADFEAIVRDLDDVYRAPLTFLYWTGWRVREALTLEWSNVDLKEKEVRLVPERDKTRKGRVLCYGSIPALVDLFEAQKERRLAGAFVFPGRRRRAGMTYNVLLKQWRAATKAAGVPAALIHDLRRTAITDMRRAAVPLSVAMQSVGHATLAQHSAYSIVARRDQLEAMESLVALRGAAPAATKVSKIGGRR